MCAARYSPYSSYGHCGLSSRFSYYRSQNLSQPLLSSTHTPYAATGAYSALTDQMGIVYQGGLSSPTDSHTASSTGELSPSVGSCSEDNGSVASVHSESTAADVSPAELSSPSQHYTSPSVFSFQQQSTGEITPQSVGCSTQQPQLSPALAPPSNHYQSCVAVPSLQQAAFSPLYHPSPASQITTTAAAADYSRIYSTYPYSAAGTSQEYSNHVGLPQISVWNNYPSVATPLGAATCNIPKFSCDTPRYKLTPERALPLIKWYEEHKQHAYPSRHEKMLLCQTTQLTFTQVSTWFANARRRMKKANAEMEKASSSSEDSPQVSPKPSPDDQDNLKRETIAV